MPHPVPASRQCLDGCGRSTVSDDIMETSHPGGGEQEQRPDAGQIHVVHDQTTIEQAGSPVFEQMFGSDIVAPWVRFVNANINARGKKKPI